LRFWCTDTEGEILRFAQNDMDGEFANMSKTPEGGVKPPHSKAGCARTRPNTEPSPRAPAQELGGSNQGAGFGLATRWNVCRANLKASGLTCTDPSNGRSMSAMATSTREIISESDKTRIK
jgi:hypothetical protein